MKSQLRLPPLAPGAPASRTWSAADLIVHNRAEVVGGERLRRLPVAVISIDIEAATTLQMFSGRS
jgi:hypothetical protein